MITPSIQGLIKENDSLQLECGSPGFPLPQIKWLRNNKVISENSRLNYDKVTRKNAGILECVSQNSFGIKRKSYELKIACKFPNFSYVYF